MCRSTERSSPKGNATSILLSFIAVEDLKIIVDITTKSPRKKEIILALKVQLVQPMYVCIT